MQSCHCQSFRQSQILQILHIQLFLIFVNKHRRCRGTLSQNRTTIVKTSSNPETYLPGLKWIGPKILEPVESTHIVILLHCSNLLTDYSSGCCCSRRWGLFRCSRSVTSAFSVFILYSCTLALDMFSKHSLQKTLSLALIAASPSFCSPLHSRTSFSLTFLGLHRHH